jgi:hypothetical protein
LLCAPQISAVLNKDGGVENCEVQGTMSLQVGCWAIVLFFSALFGGAAGAH